jgi:hypothetical protein
VADDSGLLRPELMDECDDVADEVDIEYWSTASGRSVVP